MKIGDAVRALDRLAAKTAKKKATDAVRIVVELTADGARMLEMDVSGGQPRILRSTVLDLDPTLTEAEKKNAFLHFINPAGKKDLPKTTLCWFEGMVFRQLTLPDMPAEDTSKALLWDLKKKFYFNPDENLLGYKEVADVEGAEGPEKLYNVFYCESKTALAKLGFVQSLGVEVDCLVPGPVALAAFAASAQSAPAGKETAVCDLSASGARILVVRAEKNMLVRNAPLSVADGIWSDDTLNRIAEEIRKTIDFYEAQKFARPVGNVLFTGSGPDPERLVAYMTPKLGLPVAYADVSRFAAGSNEEERNAVHAHGGLFATAIGAAASPDDTLNLVPSEIKSKNLQRRYERWLSLGVLFLGALLFVSTGLTWLNAQWTQGRMKSLESEYARLGEGKKTFEELLRRERVRRAVLKGDVPLDALLKDLGSRTPGPVALTELRYDRAEGTLMLAGAVTDSRREDSKTVSQFAANLAGSPFFRTAEPANVSQDEESKSTRFEIAGTLKGFA